MSQHSSSTDVPVQPKILKAEDLLVGSKISVDVAIPLEIIVPASGGATAPSGIVRLRPINLATLVLISRAARDDPSLVPVLMVKEALIEPALTLDQVRQLNIGLVQFLVAQINRISGITATGQEIEAAVGSPFGQTLVLLARHFGWTPEQVGHLTPGQVAVYLAGVEQLLRLEKASG